MSNSGQSGGWQGGGVVGGRHMPHATSHIDQASNHQTISSTWPAQPLNLTPPPSSYELCKSLAANVAQTQTQIRIQPQAERERERGRARVRWPVEEKNQTKSIDVQIFLNIRKQFAGSGERGVSEVADGGPAKGGCLLICAPNDRHATRPLRGG